MRGRGQHPCDSCTSVDAWYHPIPGDHNEGGARSPFPAVLNKPLGRRIPPAMVTLFRPVASVAAVVGAASVMVAALAATVPAVSAASADTATPAPTERNVLVLDLSCGTRCVAQAVRKTKKLGCTDVFFFDTLRMIAATCPKEVFSGNGTAAGVPDLSSVSGVVAWSLPRLFRTSTPAAHRPPGTIPTTALGPPRGRLIPVPIPPRQRRFWGLDRINQVALPLDGISSTAACYPLAGDGVHVFVIDTGCRTDHQQFAHMGSRLTAVAPVGANYTHGHDKFGHGSHVIGTIAGIDTGVAPSVNVTSVNVFGHGPFAIDADIIGGVEMAAAYAVAHPSTPVLLSASLGGGYQKDDVLATAMERAAAAGVVSITASGNDDLDACWFSPGGAPRVINVANGDRHDLLAETSNFGSCIDVIAPGTHIVSVDARDRTSLVDFSGTSMAAPHVTGVAALVLGQVGRRLSREEVLRAVTWGRVTVAGYPLAYASPVLRGVCP